MSGNEPSTRSLDVEALTALGKSLLARAPADSYDGVKAVVDAANGGGAEAAYLCGAMAAVGAGLPQSWTMAFDCLAASAERGWAPARDEIKLLAARRSESWKALRDAVDIGALLAPGALEPVHAAPRIAVVEKFLTPELCDWLVARAGPRIVRARTFSGIDESRSNSAAEFGFLDLDIVLALVRARIASLTGLPVTSLENTQILHYATGQQFAPHYDYLDASQAGPWGQRAATFLVYLNDDFDAAETSFLKLDWRYRGAKGDAILFWNVDPSGAPDPLTLHAGLAPTRGEKWLLSQWIRQAP
ncbi:MAG TPA: 2OG-Fe(II) oxygenase [Rhizomicrobium sp.]|nr:2OG-Fe(II) oxygenase [Rhizomicrobium sp.]